MLATLAYLLHSPGSKHEILCELQSVQPGKEKKKNKKQKNKGVHTTVKGLGGPDGAVSLFVAVFGRARGGLPMISAGQQLIELVLAQHSAKHAQSLYELAQK